MNNLTSIFKKYSNHPDFLGIELTDPNQRGSVDDTPLHIAVRKGTESDVLELIKIGANVNMLGDLGNTPLHYAAMTGRANIVQLLLDHDANYQVLNEFSETPLKVAKQGGKHKVIDILSKIQ